jgi:hypothetical protein
MLEKIIYKKCFILNRVTPDMLSLGIIQSIHSEIIPMKDFTWHRILISLGEVKLSCLIPSLPLVLGMSAAIRGHFTCLSVKTDGPVPPRVKPLD